MNRYLLVLLGGGVGSVARYAASFAINARVGGRFPFGTLIVNITGSFLIGLIMVLLTERLAPHENWRILLVSGFLGGYTTFSAFEFETYQAIFSGAYWMGFVNVLASVILGFAGVCLGVFVARR